MKTSHSSSVWQLISADINRYMGLKKCGFFKFLHFLYDHPGALYLIMFRLTQCVDNLKCRILRVLIKVFFVWTVFKFVSILLGIHIASHAKIGKGFYIGHFGCIYIGPVEIGECCNVSQEVTIGYGRAGSDRFGLPTIGDQVYIAPGAKIFGKVRIGSRVSIGANSVVSKDLPEGAIAVGNPARIIGHQDKNPYIQNTL